MEESYRLKEETEKQLQNATGTLQRIYELGSSIQRDLAKKDFRKIQNRLSEIQMKLQEVGYVLENTSVWRKTENIHSVMIDDDYIGEIKLLLKKIAEMDENIIKKVQDEETRVTKELEKLSRAKDSLHGYDKNLSSNFYKRNSGHKLQVVR